MQVVLVYLQWFRRSSLLKCVLQPKIWKKKFTKTSLLEFTKTSLLGVQGRSRSSMLVPPESKSAILVMTHCKSVSICNHSHARWANSGTITISDGVLLFDALVRGESPPSGTKFAHKKLETLRYHRVKTRSLSHLGSAGRTDGQTELW